MHPSLSHRWEPCKQRLHPLSTKSARGMLQIPTSCLHFIRLEMRKQRPEQVRRLAQDHTAWACTTGRRSLGGGSLSLRGITSHLHQCGKPKGAARVYLHQFLASFSEPALCDTECLLLPPLPLSGWRHLPRLAFASSCGSLPIPSQATSS